MSASEQIRRERGLRDAVLAGDEAAWQAWYSEAFDGLYRYVLWRCGGLRDNADEVVQEIGKLEPAEPRDVDRQMRKSDSPGAVIG